MFTHSTSPRPPIDISIYNHYMHGIRDIRGHVDHINNNNNNNNNINKLFTKYGGICILNNIKKTRKSGT